MMERVDGATGERIRQLEAQVRELTLEAAKERSLAEQATQARNTAQAKIRELEADYQHENEGRRAIEALYSQEKARAEKAEALLAESIALNVEIPTLRARVAELENRRYPDAQCRDACIEAREREAE